MKIKTDSIFRKEGDPPLSKWRKKVGQTVAVIKYVISLGQSDQLSSTISFSNLMITEYV